MIPILLPVIVGDIAGLSPEHRKWLAEITEQHLRETSPGMPVGTAVFEGENKPLSPNAGAVGEGDMERPIDHGRPGGSPNAFWTPPIDTSKWGVEGDPFAGGLDDGHPHPSTTAGPVDDWQPKHLEPFNVEQGNRLYCACVGFNEAMKARREMPEETFDHDPLFLINAGVARARRVAKETKLPPDLVVDAVETLVDLIEKWPPGPREIWRDGWRVNDAETFEFSLRLLCQVGEVVARRAALSAVFSTYFRG